MPYVEEFDVRRPSFSTFDSDPVRTAADAVLVAIDVSKARNDVLIEKPGSARRRRLVVPNTRIEHDRFIALLTSLDAPVIAGFEATGNYHRPLAFRLLEAGISLRLVSSVALARTREALHNGWDKNDPKDAQVILHMLKIGATQTYADPLVTGINDIQELSKTHEIISKAKTELWHRLLTHYLPLYFPEVARFAGNSRSDWFLAFLEAFPTPASITALSKEAFIKAAWSVIGRKVSKSRLLGDIYETAVSSIGLPVALDSAAISMFRVVITEGRSLIRQRDLIESQAHAMLAGHPDYQRLRQIPGIGPITAMTVLAEAGDLRRFGHHRQFLKFCGLDLATYQSGSSGARRSCQSSAMRGCDAPSGSQPRLRSASPTTASEPNTSATSRGIVTTPISSARRSQPLPPRWRAPHMRSSKAVPTIGLSFEGPVPGGRTSLSRSREGASATL